MINFSFYNIDEKVFLSHLEIIYNRYTHLEKSMCTLSHIILEKLNSKLKFGVFTF